MPYPPMAPMQHQVQAEPASHDSRPSVFSRLNFGDLSSSGVERGQPIASRTLTTQEKGKAPIKQVYVPKKKDEVSAAPT